MTVTEKARNGTTWRAGVHELPHLWVPSSCVGGVGGTAKIF